MTISKPSLILAWYAVIALSTILGLGMLENGFLVLSASAMALSIILRPSLPTRVIPVFYAFVLLFVLYSALTAISPSARGISNTVNIFVSAAFFLFFAKNAHRFIRFPGVPWVSLLSGCLIVVAGMMSQDIAKNTVSGLGAYPVLIAGLIWIARGAPPVRTAILMFVIIGVIGFVLGHRMMAGVGFIAVAALLALRVAPLEFTRTVILTVIVASIFALIAFYAGLWGLDIRVFDDVVKEASGRTAVSGRQEIWPIIIKATSVSPWVGRGTGTLFGSIYDSDLSAHSYFLHIYLQTGILGLISLGFVLLTVWRAIGRPQRHNPVSMYTSVCFVIVLVHSSLEVFLMQANPTIGCSVWTLLGIGIGILRSEDTPYAQVQTITQNNPYVHA